MVVVVMVVVMVMVMVLLQLWPVLRLVPVLPSSLRISPLGFRFVVVPSIRHVRILNPTPIVHGFSEPSSSPVFGGSSRAAMVGSVRSSSTPKLLELGVRRTDGRSTTVRSGFLASRNNVDKRFSVAVL